MNNRQGDEREACLYLKAKGLSRKEIGERLGLSERQVKRRLSSSANGNLNQVRFGITNGRFSNQEDNNDFFTFPMSKDDSLFTHEKADQKRINVAKYIEEKYSGKDIEILNLSDLHIPFTMYDDVIQIVKQADRADIVVINGDLFDLFAVSKFSKDKEIALRREVEEGREFLEFLSSKFEDVIITEGNHERRLRSYINNIIPPDLQFLFKSDIIKMVVDGDILEKDELKNVHAVGSWWIKLFDVIFAHPDNYSSTNLKTVQNTSEHFSLVKNIKHRACIIGHTHRAGWIVSGEVLLVETGCLCYDMDYHNGSKFTKSQWTRAYSNIFINKNGQIDFNRFKLTIV